MQDGFVPMKSFAIRRQAWNTPLNEQTKGKPAKGKNGRKVLLFDDSDLCLAFAREVLAAEGFDVRMASTLIEFDRILIAWGPDVILADVRMPEIDGAELCRRLKQSLHTAHVPVVLFSSLAEATLAALATGCGADAYLSKAEGFDQLPAKISSLCEEILW